jgi:hypothetical protein
MLSDVLRARILRSLMDACDFGLVWWASGALSHLGALVCIGRSFSSPIRRACSRCRRRRWRSARRVRGACSPFLSSTTTQRQRTVRRRSRPRAQKNRNLDIPCLYSRRRGHAHEAAVDGEQALARSREAATAGQPLSLVEAHAPPPPQSKASLKAWWNTFSLAHSFRRTPSPVQPVRPVRVPVRPARAHTAQRRRRPFPRSTRSSASRSATASNTRASRSRPRTPAAISTSGDT